MNFLHKFVTEISNIVIKGMLVNNSIKALSEPHVV